MLNWLKNLFKPKTVPAPMQWTVFALRNMDEAKPIASPPYSPGLLAKISAVNSRVNAGIIPRREKSDVWTLWPKEGDCDDYAVTKRHELRKLGIPSCLAVVKLQTGEGHCVLIVKLTSGEFILDNRYPSPIPSRSKTGYTFLMEQTLDPNVWINS